MDYCFKAKKEEIVNGIKLKEKRLYCWLISQRVERVEISAISNCEESDRVKP